MHPLRLPRMPRLARGFTLIELMVVVSMLALLSALAGPGLRQLVDGQRVKSAAFDLTTDLLLARSETLKRNRIVVFAPRGGDWRQGWTATANGIELVNRSPLSANLNFGNAPVSISFNAFGRVDVPANAVRVNLAATDASNRTQRCIELDLSGRASSRVGSCT
jgi:type IV fimbrial biogenesis protein FimT